MYRDDRLVILDADGTTIDAFTAIGRTFAEHGMDIGPLERFQKRRHLFKYLGGIKEFPGNLKKQISAGKRARLVATLTEIYREEAGLYEGIAPLLERLVETPDLRVGIVTRNITQEPVTTIERLLGRVGIDPGGLDFLVHLPLRADKLPAFRELRERFEVNPARAFVCGDESRDYRAAVSAGMHPFIVSYGFEGYDRLHLKHGVPAEVISRTPGALVERISHGLALGVSGAGAA